MALADLPSSEGVARLVFGQRGTTHLARLFQKSPLRVLVPRPAPGEPPCAVLLNTSGGIVGGDALRVAVRLETGAVAVVTTQAAEKAYRSAGAEATVEVDLDLADETWLEWLPQETILFDGARLRRTLRVDLGLRARLVAADMLVFGRRARAEQFRTGLLSDRWEVRVGRRLVWADTLRLAPEPGALLEAPFGSPARVRSRPASTSRRTPGIGSGSRRAGQGQGVRAGVTCIGPVLVVRWLAADPAPLRQLLQRFFARFRHGSAVCPSASPPSGRPEPLCPEVRQRCSTAPSTWPALFGRLSPAERAGSTRS